MYAYMGGIQLKIGTLYLLKKVKEQRGSDPFMYYLTLMYNIDNTNLEKIVLCVLIWVISCSNNIKW